MYTAAELLWRSLRRGWWIILLACGVAVGAATVTTSGEPAVFQAVVEMATTPNTGVETDRDVLSAIELLDHRTLIATLARVPTTKEVIREAAERIGWASGQADRFHVTTRLEPYTFIVRVEVSGPDQDQAVQLADSIAWVSRRESHGLYRLFSLREIGGARAEGTVRPSESRNLVVAAILGLFSGLIGTMLWTSYRLRASS